MQLKISINHKIERIIKLKDYIYLWFVNSYLEIWEKKQKSIARNVNIKCQIKSIIK